MKEMRNLEYKETITNTFLKTVSAYANYNGGIIIFGISDQGEKKGIENQTDVCLDIENKINDSIKPQPEYTLDINTTDKTITLSVKGGSNKPYLYKSKAYKRNDTATIEVDELEFTRLVLEGKNMKYEELPASNQALSFNMLEKKLKEKIAIEKFNMDVLKTLNLYSADKGFNNVAELLSDKNHFSGIDAAKFGESISIIQKRETFDKTSVLEEYENIISIYKDYYQHEEITEAFRKKIERVPEAAFRETIANALIHRSWDIEAHIRVLMFDDRIEITSPGGLPNGISEDEFLSGRISVLRNPILANVFYRLGIVEIFGTGILRIAEVYKDSTKKPKFEVTENSIKVILPVVESEIELNDDQRSIYNILSKTITKPMSEILAHAEFSKSKVTKILKELERKELVKVEGTGRGTKYRL